MDLDGDFGIPVLRPWSEGLRLDCLDSGEPTRISKLKYKTLKDS